MKKLVPEKTESERSIYKRKKKKERRSRGHVWKLDWKRSVLLIEAIDEEKIVLQVKNMAREITRGEI